MRTYFTHADAVVPAHQARVVVETAAAQGASRERLLDGTGMTAAMLEAPEARVSYTAFAGLVRNALAQTGNPALGLDAGASMRVPQLGMFGLALISSPTIGAALQTMVKHIKSIEPVWDVSLHVDGARARLCMREVIPLRPYSAFAAEMLIVATDTQGRALLGRALPVRRLAFHFPRPVYVERYRALYDVPMQFDRPQTELEFDASLLAEQNAFGDPATKKLADRYLAEHAPLDMSGGGLLALVRARVSGCSQQPPPIDALARELQTSARSLRRALERMGTSYQALVDELRKEKAVELTRATRLPLEEIAQRLGFSDVRGFRRAFKRWTGRTPGDFRKP